MRAQAEDRFRAQASGIVHPENNKGDLCGVAFVCLNRGTGQCSILSPKTARSKISKALPTAVTGAVSRDGGIAAYCFCRHG